MPLKIIFIFLIFYLECPSIIYTSSFPKCEDIIRVVDEIPNCEFCNTKRVQEKCSDYCKKQGCRDPNEAECNGVDPCVSLEKANAIFRKCCEVKEYGIKESCWDECRYDLKRRELQDAVLTGKCPLTEFREYLTCAANFKNNTDCCQRTKILDGDRNVCEPFCNPDSDDWPTKSESKYLRCVDQFDAIAKCHWASARLP